MKKRLKLNYTITFNIEVDPDWYLDEEKENPDWYLDVIKKTIIETESNENSVVAYLELGVQDCKVDLVVEECQVEDEYEEDENEDEDEVPF